VERDHAAARALEQHGELKPLEPDIEIGEVAVDPDVHVVAADVDLAIEHRVALAGVDVDLLDLDRAEVVVGEQPAVVDAERLLARRGPEGEIEVAELEALLDVADRAQPALEEPADGGRDPRRQEPADVDRLDD